MAIFNEKQEKTELEKLVETLSPKQATVARGHFRTALGQLSFFIDTGDKEFKDQLAIKIIERVKSYQMTTNYIQGE